MAGVYYNRLRAGMPLEVDATIEYVFPEHHTVITRRDLEIDSPYNTYRHTGLPPTPIANPGQSIDRRGVRTRSARSICTTSTRVTATTRSRRRSKSTTRTWNATCTN